MEAGQSKPDSEFASGCLKSDSDVIQEPMQEMQEMQDHQRLLFMNMANIELHNKHHRLRLLFSNAPGHLDGILSNESAVRHRIGPQKEEQKLTWSPSG